MCIYIEEKRKYYVLTMKDFKEFKGSFHFHLPNQVVFSAGTAREYIRFMTQHPFEDWQNVGRVGIFRVHAPYLYCMKLGKKLFELRNSAMNKVWDMTVRVHYLPTFSPKYFKIFLSISVTLRSLCVCSVRAPGQAV